jgi:hypothetical protein
VLFIAGTLGVSWLAMQIVHELGHIAGAWATGGRIAEVKLHPAAISYTLLSVNPQPLVVAWSGPIAGVVLPVLAWLCARQARLRGWYVLQFFAGFCLVANGAYLAGGAFYDMGDASELLRHGAARPLVYVFGVSTTVIGIFLGSGLGPHFGFAQAGGHVDKGVAYVVVWIWLAIVALELALA